MSKLQQEYKLHSVIMTARTERKAEVSPRLMARMAGVNAERWKERASVAGERQ